MKLLLLIFSVMMNSMVLAQDSVKILGRNMDFVEINKVNYSLNCKKSCKAKDAVDAYLLKPFPLKSKTTFLSGKGSILCRDYWKKVSLLGIKSDKSQGAYCLFEDQSLVDLMSLGEILK